MSNLQTVSPTRAAELIRQGAVLVDIREADEHARENIPGSRHYALSGIDRSSPVGTGNDVLVLACSGTGVMEASVSNLTSPGDKVLVLTAGKFGERMAKLWHNID